MQSITNFNEKSSKKEELKQRILGVENGQIIRADLNKENPFAQIRKASIQDPNLSWQATGLLAYILQLPDFWELNKSHLISVKKNGRDSVESCMKELILNGYMFRFQKRNEDGSFGKLVYIAFSNPADNPFLEGEAFDDSPQTGNPLTVNPQTGNPLTVNPHLYNNKYINTNKDLCNDEKSKNFLLSEVLKNQKIDEWIEKSILKSSRWKDADVKQVKSQLTNFVEKKNDKEIFAKKESDLEEIFVKWLTSFVEGELANFAWGNVGDPKPKIEVTYNEDPGFLKKKNEDLELNQILEKNADAPSEWKEFLKYIKNKFGIGVVKSWFIKIKCEVQNGIYVLKASTELIRDYVLENYIFEIERFLNVDFEKIRVQVN